MEPEVHDMGGYSGSVSVYCNDASRSETYRGIPERDEGMPQAGFELDQEGPVTRFFK